jgi:hypothetical protein
MSAALLRLGSFLTVRVRGGLLVLEDVVQLHLLVLCVQILELYLLLELDGLELLPLDLSFLVS